MNRQDPQRTLIVCCCCCCAIVTHVRSTGHASKGLDSGELQLWGLLGAEHTAAQRCYQGRGREA